MINCPNPNCKTANPEGVIACQVCRSALPHYYLWGVGDLVNSLKPGSLVAQRYLLKRDRIFLDTKPGLLPESLVELPGFLRPYLHLSAYPLHVPRPYSVLRTPDKDHLMLLESAALSMAAHPEVPGLLPLLSKRWADAPPLRQLSWLWQIAQLWDAFEAEQVAGTLIDDALLRVDGSILRLLELKSRSPLQAGMSAGLQTSAHPPPTPPPTLVDLSRSWQPLVQMARSSVRSFLQRLCEKLERQQLNAEQLCEQLAQAMSVCGQGQAVSFDLAVYTDQGPTRKRNEDACFPVSGTAQVVTGDQTRKTPQLLIVCDGIGGHQGGDVASKLAISTIQEQLEPVLAENAPTLTPTEMSLAIERAICAANDEISSRNDQAQRQARDRMGTTLVLALMIGAEVYIAHLGDSRAYRVSSRNCQQVTLDDDVASRQVRLGGSLYREMLVQPGAGSLIQALGMGPSETLKPTVQRFVVDENCVFLLCSDGLSDSDRVEQFWRQVLQPMLTSDAHEQRSSAAVGQRLVGLANKFNGHDNVTVGLLNAQVLKVSDRMVPRELAAPRGAEKSGTKTDSTKAASSGRRRAGQTRLFPSPVDASASTALISTPRTDNAMAGEAMSATSQRDSKGGLKKVGALFVLLVIAGGLIYFWVPGFRTRLLTSGRASTPDASVGIADDDPLPAAPGAVAPARPVVLEVGDYARIRPVGKAEADGAAAGGGAAESFPQMTLYPSPDAGSRNDPNTITGTVPTGGIVQVMGKQTAEDQSNWVQLQLCSIPSGETLADVPAETDTPTGVSPPLNAPESVQTGRPLMLSPGREGWIVESKLSTVSEAIQDLQPSQKGTCES
ncbi:MAG: protein phosphatase 2C domain-containing protein [Cyanobacteria bacterium J06631_12]